MGGSWSGRGLGAEQVGQDVAGRERPWERALGLELERELERGRGR